MVQSLNDPASYGFCYKPPCGIKGNTPGNCKPQQLEALAQYHNALRGNITHAQSAFGTRDSHFLTSCNQHEETCRQQDWWGITINGQTMNSTFYAWYTQGTRNAPGASAIDVAWPNDGNTDVNRACTHTHTHTHTHRETGRERERAKCYPRTHCCRLPVISIASQ